MRSADLFQLVTMPSSVLHRIASCEDSTISDICRLMPSRRSASALIGSEIVDDADEDPLAEDVSLADRQIHGKCRTILAPALDFAPDADDPPFAGLLVSGDIGIVLLAIGRGHQHGDVLPQDFIRRIKKQALAGAVIDLNGTDFVDDHDPVDRRGDQRLEQLVFDP